MKYAKTIAIALFLGCIFFCSGSVYAEKIDSDYDCVYDDIDKCPDTPITITVDEYGCPLDSDGDKVYDHKDKCPGTPANVSVDEHGCPLDSDGDGVYDHKDKCPGTPAGMKVDNVGCIIQEKVSIELEVEFDTDKAVVKPMYHGNLQKFADFLNKYSELNTVIEGHTDSVSSDEYNLALSSKRANAIRTYLIENFGIQPRRIIAKGFGESAPRADNRTAEGRQSNRRVIAVISAMVPIQ